MPHNKSQNSHPHNLTKNDESPQRITKRKCGKNTAFIWLEGPISNVHGETALWLAVITQAMMDALSRSKNPEQVYHKYEAIRWLTERNKHFDMVCEMAGRSPDDVRRKAKRALLSPASWRASPGKGKRYLERKEYRKRIRQEARAAKQMIETKPIVICGTWSKTPD